jgi:hypothetical protein
VKEPDVTLTDYALALECAVFCVILLRGAAGDTLRRWWAFFFATIGLAAFIGGTVHGFLPGNAALWTATMLTLGLTSLAGWFIGSLLLGMRWLRPVAVLLLGIYAGIVLFVNSTFVVAIAMYLPATMFLLLAMVARYATARERAVAIGVVGLLMTFAAAAVQQLKVGVHPVFFNHNALYHVIQFVALWLIFVAARREELSADCSGSQISKP